MENNNNDFKSIKQLPFNLEKIIEMYPDIVKDEKDDPVENEKLRELFSRECAIRSMNSNIFVSGKVNNPLSCIREAKFTPQIKENLNKKGYHSIFPIQRFSFNEILAKKSVFIINGLVSGKTISYLPALLTLLSKDAELENSDENDVPISQGPIGIIIVKTAREVEVTYKLCQSLISATQLKIMKAAGMWNLDQKKIELLNGNCHLLITTPPCFLRLNECFTINCFDRKRIKYVVLENIDMMLDVFENELKSVISICFTKETDKNPQIIITAARWKKQIKEFLALSSEQVILIDEFIEAAIFSEVRFKVFQNTIEGKQNMLLEHLLQRKWHTMKTLIVFNQQQEMDVFKNILTNNAIGHDSLESNLNLNQIDSYSLKWTREAKGKMTLLLITDEALKSFNVDCVEILIHYSLPSTWSAFSRRFSVSIDSYKKYIDNKNKCSQDRPTSLILLDENNVMEMPHLIDFLIDRRLLIKIPDNIMKTIQNIRDDMEKQKLKNVDDASMISICTKFISFGRCPDGFRCMNRHSFFCSDKKALPSSGKIRFKIFAIVNPLSYSIVVKSYLPKGGKEWINYADKNEKIKKALEEMNTYMQKESNTLIDAAIEVGKIYGYWYQHKWHRCKVLRKREKSKYETSFKIDISLIDREQELHNILSTSLMKLPDKFKNYDPFVVKLYITNMKPYDCDETFDKETTSVIETHLKKPKDRNEYIECDIDISFQNVFISKNFTICKYLTHANANIIRFDLKNELLSKKYALYDETIFDEIKRNESSIEIQENKCLEEIKSNKKVEEEDDWSDQNVSEDSISSSNIRRKFMKFKSCDEVNTSEVGVNTALCEVVNEKKDQKTAEECFIEILQDEENNCCDDQEIFQMKGFPQARFLPLVVEKTEITEKLPMLQKNSSESNIKEVSQISPSKVDEPLNKIYNNAKISWNQDKVFIFMKIECIEAVDYSLYIDDSSIDIYIKYPNKLTAANIKLYNRIDPQYVSHMRNGMEIRIYLIKRTLEVMWPRLTFSAEKNNFIKHLPDESTILTTSSISNQNQISETIVDSRFIVDSDNNSDDNESDLGEVEDDLENEVVL